MTDTNAVDDPGLITYPDGYPKAHHVLDYQRSELRCLIETGTSIGTTLAALVEHGDFDKIYSIEVAQEYHNQAAERFAGNPKVQLICGDTEQELAPLLDRLHEPCLFWLDAHSSYRGGPTPIKAELAIIFERPWGHTVLIDDARIFGSPLYPAWPPLSWIEHEAATHGYDYAMADDIVRLTPR